MCMAHKSCVSEADSAAAAAALFAWGANSYGQLGLGHKEDVLLPQRLSNFCEPGCIKSVTGGGGHSAAVTGRKAKPSSLLVAKNQGKTCALYITSIGSGNVDVILQRGSPWTAGVLIIISNIRRSSLLPPFMCLVCCILLLYDCPDGGSLFVCGLNKDGQLGLGHTEDVLCFTICKPLLGCPIRQVACGWDFTIMLTEIGQVLSCGSNAFGQLGVPHGPRRCVVPQAVELLREKVVCVAAGLRHALATTVSGSVFQWGTGLASSGRRLCAGQTLPLFLTAKEPSRVMGLEDSTAVCVVAGSDHSASLTDTGELYVWGRNKHGQLASLAAFLLLPQRIDARCFQDEKVTAVWSGWTHLVAQTETGKVFTWGRADYGQLGRRLESPEGQKPHKQDSQLTFWRPQSSVSLPLCCLTGAAKISCGSEHNLAVISDKCFSWGWNEHGMCGDGTESNVWTPSPVQALQSPSRILLVGCGAGHSLALCQLPALSEPCQDVKVIYTLQAATGNPESQNGMNKERNRKERQSVTSTQSNSDRTRNEGP